MPDRRSAQLKVAVDRRQIDELLAELKEMPSKMAKAEVSAVKKTMRAAETKIAKNVGRVANLKAKDIKGRIRQSRKPGTQSPSGVLTISGARLPLWKFSRSMADLQGFQSQKGTAVSKRKPKKGAGWKIFKSEGRKRDKSLFVARNTKTSQIEIMQRADGGKGGSAAKPGVDYRIKFGLSIAEIMKRKKLTQPAIEEVAEILKKNLQSQVDRFLKRKKSDRA